MPIRMQQRRGTSTSWTGVTLAPGEVGLDISTGQIKIGDGVLVWADLPYYILQKYDTTSTWSASSAVVKQGLFCLDESGYLKIGNGTGTWNELNYFKPLGDILGGASSEYDTLGEIENVIIANKAVVTGIQSTASTDYNNLKKIEDKVIGNAAIVTGIQSTVSTDYNNLKKIQDKLSATETYVTSNKPLDSLSDVVIGISGGLGITLADKQTLQYESSTSQWRNKIASGGVTVNSIAPSTPIAGDAWFDSNDGTLYVYYNDGNTVQWVQVQANSALEGTILARLGGVESSISTINTNINTNGYRYLTSVYFASSGTFSKASYPGIRAVRVRLVGGGGSGGGSAATGASPQMSYGQGGGGGGYAEKLILVSALDTSETVTVGAGGVGSVASGVVGGSTSFGTKVAANGGGGGPRKIADQYGSYTGGSAGGVGTAGDFLTGGGAGSLGDNAGSGLAASGQGGSSALGGGGQSYGSGGSGSSTAGAPGQNYGGGGGGALSTASAAQNVGGSGGAGIVIVEVYV
jgi:hypothetical protein